jgi:hypothetical protein
MAWLNLLLKGKKVAGAIKSVAPKLTKGESTAVKLHKLKAAMKKGTDDASDAIRTGTDKIIKSLDKMKGPKK